MANETKKSWSHSKIDFTEHTGYRRRRTGCNVICHTPYPPYLCIGTLLLSSTSQILQCNFMFEQQTMVSIRNISIETYYQVQKNILLLNPGLLILYSAVTLIYTLLWTKIILSEPVHSTNSQQYIPGNCARPTHVPWQCAPQVTHVIKLAISPIVLHVLQSMSAVPVKQNMSFNSRIFYFWLIIRYGDARVVREHKGQFEGAG